MRAHAPDLLNGFLQTASLFLVSVPPLKAPVLSPPDYCSHSTRLLAATTLRNVLGTKNLSEILSERDTISNVMKTLLDEATDPWGVRVERVEVKDVRLPVQLQRAMAAEAEAAREARAKVFRILFFVRYLYFESYIVNKSFFTHIYSFNFKLCQLEDSVF